MRKILCKTVLPILITLTTLTTFTACSNQNNSKIENTDYKKMYEDVLKDQAPIIKDITFKTMDGKPIKKNAKWYMLDKQVKITITLEGNCQYVDLFVTPAGTETSKMQKLIEEVDTNKNVAEYIWNVPDDTLGHFNIIAYNKNVGRKSDFYNVASRKTLNNSQ